VTFDDDQQRGGPTSNDTSSSGLELLQTHGRIIGAELAERLAVNRRTVRRYIALSEELGIPIATERGPRGGCELVAGFKLPPLMFTHEEVLAIGLGLAAVNGLELADTAPAVAGAQAKLERVIRAGLKGRMRAIGESVAFAQPGKPNMADRCASLPLLSSSAHTRTGVRLQYRALSGDESQRDFNPYGLAFSSGRWYVVSYCHLRRGLRTFRFDRVTGALAQGRNSERPERFDVVAHLATSIATLPRRFSPEVLLHADLESARRELFPSIGLLEPAGPERVLLRSQADDLDWFARELARLPWAFEILGPVELMEAVDRLVACIASACKPLLDRRYCGKDPNPDRG
jgi:predicted DNA-binding transcriptional regulator YafY